MSGTCEGCRYAREGNCLRDGEFSQASERPVPVAFNRRTDMNKASIEPVTRADRDIADAVAEAIASVSVAYSHNTGLNFETKDRRWFVHDVCEGNPFDKAEWLGEFTSKADANEFARKLRQTRAYEAAARHRTTPAPSQHSELAKLAEYHPAAIEIGQIYFDHHSETNGTFECGERLVQAADKAIRRSPDTARVETLEEAAKVADNWGVGHPHIAKAIRSKT
jgi:hypothetical protein